MKQIASLFLAAAACLALADCRLHREETNSAHSPVVATVGRQKITLDALNAEMTAPSPRDPGAHQAAADATLRNMIARDILSQAARRRGLDKTPTFERAKARIVDTMLVQALEQRLAAEAPPPTRAQAQQFMAARPDTFARRKIFVLDQLRMARPSDPALIAALGPMKSLDQIAALLTANRVPFQRDTAKLDAVGADPALIAALAKLPAGELFVLPQGQILSVNQIKGSSVVPFTGEPAIAYAQKTLAAQQSQSAVQVGLKALFVKAAKQVKLAKGYAGADPMAALTSPSAARAVSAPNTGAATTSGGG